MAVSLVFAFLAGGAAATTPDGPRLAVVRDGIPLPGEELLNTDPLGEHWFRVANTPHSHGSFENLSWSGDGTRIAFGAFFGGAIYTVPGEGGVPRAVAGTKRGFNPVFSPNGQAIAFARFRFRKRGRGRRPYFSISTWLADAQGGRSRQLTPWRNGLLLAPSSFSPDGTLLAAERGEPGKAPRVVSVPIDGGPHSLIVKNGTEPQYSPDGSTIAFVRHTVRRVPKRRTPLGYVTGGDLFVAASDGSGIRRLTFNPARREESPSWDPSGERLAYAQFPTKLTLDARTGTGSAIMEINADGTCRHRLLFTYGLSYRAAAWQPGPGREAGRIEC